MEDRRGAYRALAWRSDGREPLGKVGVDWMIILKVISKSGVGRSGLVGSGTGTGQVAGTCECGNEPSDSIKFWEFLN
jgi:hypothetical protein